MLRSPDSKSSEEQTSRNGPYMPVYRCTKNTTTSAASTPVLSPPAYQGMATVGGQAPARCGAEAGAQHYVDEESNAEIIYETIMATTIAENGTMGCAFFSTQDNRLYIAQDVPLVDALTLQHFLEHVQPSSILISDKFPNSMVEVLDTYVDRVYQEEAKRSHVISVANSEFSISASRDKLTGTFSAIENQPGAIFHLHQTFQIKDRATGSILPESESSVMQKLRLSSVLGTQNSTSIICAGVVVAEVNKRRAAQSQRDIGLAGLRYNVQSMEPFHLSEYLYINPAAMSSLQILHCEMHPNSQTWHTTSGVANKKEGLSVYGMFHHLVSTSQGRVQLRKIFLRPSTSVSLITARHQTISILLQPQNSEVLSQIVSAVRKVPNMTGLVSKLSKGIDCTSVGHSARGGLWAALERFSRYIVEVQRLAGSFSDCESAPLLKKFRDTIEVGAIACVGSLIKKTIDFEQSKLRERYSIQSGVDPNLDRLKRRYDGMESFLTEVVDNIVENSASWARQYIKSCIFLPQLGFLLVVDLDESTGNGKYSGEGQSHDSWEKIFSANGSVCYKTRQMQELDEAYGDMYCQIGDREVELLHGLALSVLEYSSHLLLASKLTGELDAILALALGAQKFGWNKPGISLNGSSYITGGRHPLHEASMQHFIPNDFGVPANEEDKKQKPGRVLVVTGPNHSGKSVYLKQVALIFYLAHIGSFVPAEEATIAITDKILVCMPTQESASSNESAFATDLRGVSHSIRRATEKSLVLVDEFGKGTCPINGAGLAAGLLGHFLSLGCERCPQVIIATHFHEIFDFEDFNGYGLLDFAHMKVEINHDDSRTGDDPLIYLFTLQCGRSSSSFGEQCATMNGVPEAVVNRAGAISFIIDHDGDLTATCATLSYSERARLEIAEEVARKFISLEFGVCKPPHSTFEALETLDSLLL